MRSLESQGISDAFDRARSGALFGLGMAAIYVAYVVGLYILRGSEPFDKVHTSLSVVVLSYVILGPIAGAFVGLLQPLSATRIGSMFVAFVGASVVYFGITIAMSGSPLSWSGWDWASVPILGVIFGVILGNWFYKKPKPSSPPPVSHLRTVKPPSSGPEA
jgi:hypothetical protein